MSKAVIFDHDGVIIDNQPAQKLAWKKLFDEYGFTISNEEMSQNIRGRSTFEGLKKLFRGRFSDNELLAIAKRKEQLYTDIFQKDFRAVKGFNALVEDLNRNNIPMAIATSTTNELLNYSIKRMQIGNFFDVIVTAENISKSKPDPQIYLVTASKLKIEPADCIVFEDSFSGIRSARAAGMKVILMETTHKREEFNDEIELAISDFTEVSVLQIKKL
ncbi:MAG: HAD family phosphatase [Patescibacteria group bacterium]|jgi:HAD superfamily hydrolase (TIGR01509 family)